MLKRIILRGSKLAFAGEPYVITSGRRQILTFLLSTYENAVQQNHDLIYMQRNFSSLMNGLRKGWRNGQSQLKESEENFKALADNASDGILISASDGRHRYANKRKWLKITGYSITELLGKGSRIWLHPDYLKGQ